jgi:hypothetical protein
MLVEDYVVFVFDFGNKLLVINGVVLLFHLDNLCVLREIKSYLECYSFQIWMKWAIANSLPLTRLEDFSMKVLIKEFPLF